MDIDDRAYCQSPDFDAWLLVIDKDVSIMGRQKLVHVFVDVKTGGYSTMELEGRAIVVWDTSRNIVLSSGQDSGKNGVNGEKFPVRSSGATRWAVIISGGCDSFNNYSRYYNDCVNIYSKLTQELGYPKNNIFCLVADGTNPAADQRTGPNTYVSSDPDLDNDGTNDIQYEANKANISSVFSNLSLLVSPGDEVLVFMTDHGDENGRFYLWGYETLSPVNLNTELNKLGPLVSVDVVIECCYSGAFISSLSASNRTIATACSSTEESWGNGYQYNYFVHYWTENISFSNANGDGYVSPAELFLLANESVIASLSQHPQYNSTPTDFGTYHSLAGEIIPYITGDAYVSTNISGSYSIVNNPNPSSVTWSVGYNLVLMSYTDSTAVVKGNITDPRNFCQAASPVWADIVVDGKTHRLGKYIDSVWKPGVCVGGNNIWGSNGNYQVQHYGGESLYGWQVDNPAWQIVSYTDYFVNIAEGYTNNPVNLIVTFQDPLGEVIVVQDRVR